MTNLSPNLNWHFTQKQVDKVSLEFVAFILPLVTTSSRSSSRRHIKISVQLETEIRGNFKMPLYRLKQIRQNKQFYVLAT